MYAFWVNIIQYHLPEDTTLKIGIQIQINHKNKNE